MTLLLLLLLLLGAEKKESFASAIKKRLSRGKKRSQSAERAPMFTSQSLREGTYLRPPGSPGQSSNTGSFGTEQTVYTVGTG